MKIEINIEEVYLLSVLLNNKCIELDESCRNLQDSIDSFNQKQDRGYDTTASVAIAELMLANETEDLKQYTKILNNIVRVKTNEAEKESADIN